MDKSNLKERSNLFFTMRTIVIFSAIVAIICSTCFSKERLDWPSLKSEIRKEFPAVTQISTEALEDWLAVPEKKKPLLLDAREPEEYTVSHLQDAKLVSSEREAVDLLQGLEEGHPIVLYCSVGYRSSMLANKLLARGFANVYNLEGSIFQWANEGRPVYARGVQVDVVHPYDNKWGQLLDRRLWSTPPRF